MDLTEIVPSGRTSEDKTFCKNVQLVELDCQKAKQTEGLPALLSLFGEPPYKTQVSLPSSSPWSSHLFLRIEVRKGRGQATKFKSRRLSLSPQPSHDLVKLQPLAEAVVLFERLHHPDQPKSGLIENDSSDLTPDKLTISVTKRFQIRESKMLSPCLLCGLILHPLLASPLPSLSVHPLCLRFLRCLFISTIVHQHPEMSIIISVSSY